MTSEQRVDRLCEIWFTAASRNCKLEMIAAFDTHAAEARAEQREKVAAWMIHNGYSTGHGDTIEDLLDELKDQLKKRDTRRERKKIPDHLNDRGLH